MYKDFVESTGYGTGGGLCGWNCRHTFVPFDPQTMTNNLAKYGLQENKEMYEKHQTQRYIERNIRKYKRLQETYRQALENITDESTLAKTRNNHLKYKNLVAKWNARYKEYNRENNLRGQYDRTKI